MNRRFAFGLNGRLDDDLAFAQPWGFDLSEIDVPVMIWRGDEDLMVPFAHGQWLADQLPDAHAHLEHGESRLSIAIEAKERTLDELIVVSGVGNVG